MNRRTWSCLFGLVLLSVTLLSLLPHPPRLADTGWDKLNHGLAFSLLALLASMAWRETRASRWIGLALWLLAWGMLIEAAQALTPTRQAEWGDVLADGVGIGLGLILSLAFGAGNRSRQ